MKKKILSLVMIVAMVLSVLAISPAAAAEDTVETAVEVTNAAGKRGETVTVNVLTTASSFRGGTWGFSYDKTRLKYVTGSVKDFFDAAMPTDVPAADNNAGHSQWEDMNGDGEVGNGAVIDGKVDEYLRHSPADFGVCMVLGPAKEFKTEVNRLATFSLTFEILSDAPYGDAFITPITSNKQVMILSITEGYVWRDYKAISGVVTVLPNDMAVVSAASEGLEYTYDETSGTATVSGYTGSEKDIVIPETVEKDGKTYTVTTIGEKAFFGTSLSSVIIPATVTVIGKQAFYATEITEAVFLGTGEIDIAGGKKPAFDSEEMTWYGIAGSSIKTLAEENEYSYQDYVAPAKVIVNGVTYEVAAGATEMEAPGASWKQGETFLAWEVNGVTYQPGDTVPFTDGMEFIPVTVKNPVTANGASIRLAEGTEIGLRFTADIRKADYDKLVAMYGKENISLGMMITPRVYVCNAKAFTKEALDAYAGAGKGYVDIAVEGYYNYDEENGIYTIAGSLKNFSATTLAKNPEFVAIGYITVQTENGPITVYGDYDVWARRTVAQVAASLDADTTVELTADQKKWLDDLLTRLGLS